MNADILFIIASLKEKKSKLNLFSSSKTCPSKALLEIRLNNPLQFIFPIILEWHWDGHEMLFAMSYSLVWMTWMGFIGSLILPFWLLGPISHF